MTATMTDKQRQAVAAIDVALQPGQATELRRRLSLPRQLGESLLVSHSTMRTGCSYSPRTLVSNFIRMPTMPDRRCHVTQGSVESHLDDDLRHRGRFTAG